MRKYISTIVYKDLYDHRYNFLYVVKRAGQRSGFLYVHHRNIGYQTLISKESVKI